MIMAALKAIRGSLPGGSLHIPPEVQMHRGFRNPLLQAELQRSTRSWAWPPRDGTQSREAESMDRRHLMNEVQNTFLVNCPNGSYCYRSRVEPDMIGPFDQIAQLRPVGIEYLMA
jgi:hypothetical protein